MIDEKAVREKLMRHCAECKDFASNNCDECTVPTMLVAVERHIGKEEVNGKCSVCGCETTLNLTDGGGFDYKVRFCTECGQRIRRDE